MEVATTDKFVNLLDKHRQMPTLLPHLVDQHSLAARRFDRIQEEADGPVDQRTTLPDPYWGVLIQKIDKILDGEKQANVVFQSIQDRSIYPTSIGHHRLACETMPLKGNPNIGPGKYENAEETSFTRELERRVGRSETRRGYGISARTAPARLSMITQDMINNPAPSDYQKIVPRTFEPNYKPFQSGSRRFRRVKTNDVPPPGTYMPQIGGHKTIRRKGTFGGTQELVTKIRSTKEEGLKKTFSAQDLHKFRLREAYLSLYY